jgi:hypothetical protein
VKAATGATKTRLEPDGRLGETVTQMAMWWYYERLGYSIIAERLDADLELYPPPESPGGPARARGHWSKSTVCDILTNPKYTGYQVFNRRATRSKHGAHNDPALWVWSPEPVREPLIPKWMFDEMTRRQDNILRQAQDSGPDDPFGRGLRERYNALEVDRRAVVEQLNAMAGAAELPDLPSTEDMQLLGALPFLSLNLSRAPQNLLRPLFEAMDLRIRVKADSDDIMMKITLPGELIPEVGEAAEEIAATTTGAYTRNASDVQMLVVPPTGFRQPRHFRYPGR